LVGNLLENAGKYGKPGSVAKICGGLSGSDRFYIAVANYGIPIAPGEAEKIKERGVRGRMAYAFGLEGRGIGLWIADRVMHQMGGELQVIPRNNEDMTEFRLAFNSLNSVL
jgi:signal transduction histidine kinase